MSGEVETVRTCPSCGAPRGAQQRLCPHCGFDCVAGILPPRHPAQATVPPGEPRVPPNPAVGGNAAPATFAPGEFLLLVEPEGEAPRTLVLRGVLRIGRDPAGELVLGGPKVSRRHALIRRDPEGWTLEDIHSHNGTRLNGSTVRRPVPLRPGDEIRIGGHRLRFARADSSGCIRQPGFFRRTLLPAALSDTQILLREAVRLRRLARSPALVVSLVLHVLLAVVLMHRVFSENRPAGASSFVVQLHAPRPVETPKVEERNEPVEEATVATSEPAKDEPPPKTPEVVKSDSPGPATITEVSPGFRGRGAGVRASRLRAYGGNEASEDAVLLGLRWLAAHPHAHGAWSGMCPTSACPGTSSTAGGSIASISPGMTGLALLCFLGAGHTYREGEFARVVRQGLDYLRRIQRPDGFFQERRARVNLYSHAIATYAAIEAYALTGNPVLGRMAERGCEALGASQQPSGGWSYEPGVCHRTDMSVTGWVVLALRAARAAGIRVEDRVWEKAGAAVLRHSLPDGRMIYYSEGDSDTGAGSDALIATGMVCRSVLGARAPEFQELAARRLLAVLRREMRPDFAVSGNSLGDEVTFLYYGTLALFDRGGDDWGVWNGIARDILVSAQVREEGHMKGSWRDGMAMWEAPQMAVDLAILSLEVYYRCTPAHAAPPSPEDFSRVSPQALAAGARELETGDLAAREGEYRRELRREVDIPNPSHRAVEELVSLKDRPTLDLIEGWLPTAGDAKAQYLDLVSGFPEPKAAEMLRAATRDPSRAIRTQARRALAEWERWRDGGFPVPRPETSAVAEESVDLRDELLRQDLLAELENPLNPAGRMQVARRFAAADDPQALEVLRRVLPTLVPIIRAEYLLVIADFQSSRADELLRSYLKDPSDRVRSAARMALRRWESKQAGAGGGS